MEREAGGRGPKCLYIGGAQSASIYPWHSLKETETLFNHSTYPGIFSSFTGRTQPTPLPDLSIRSNQFAQAARCLITAE